MRVTPIYLVLPLCGGWVPKTEPGVPQGGAVDARFRAVRHPDSVDAAGPYFVEVEQITGKPAVTGELRYEVRTQGTQARKGTASLRRLSPNRWQGQIPGQPPDSEICYHFAFTWGGEVRALHPRRAPLTQYRFRVVLNRAKQTMRFG